MVSESEPMNISPEGAVDAEEPGTVHGLASLKAQPGSHHHFSDTEPVQLATFINARFADEPLLKTLLPIDGTEADSFFDAWGDGMLLSVLVDAACEGAVNLAPLRRRAKKPLGVSVRHLTIQHFAVLNDALEGCKNIHGLRLGFVGAEDFVQGNRPVILGVGWQLVRLATLQRINIVDRPNLTSLFMADEVAKGIGKAGHEELLLSRWFRMESPFQNVSGLTWLVTVAICSAFNHHLEVMESEREVWSFGAELADGVAYCTLLNAIDSSACPPPQERDPEGNAENIISAVHKMGIKGVFMTEQSLLEGDRKLNVMFCAQILDAHPHLLSREQQIHEPERVLELEAQDVNSARASEDSDGGKGTASTCSTLAELPEGASTDTPKTFDIRRNLGYGQKASSSAGAGTGEAGYEDEDEDEDEDIGYAHCGFFSCVSRS